MKSFICVLSLALTVSILPVCAAGSSTVPVPEPSKQQIIINGQDIGPVIISRSQYQMSAINPTPSSNPVGAFYPGLRGGNQLIVYTPEYGQRTGTNEFGSEAIIANNKVIGLAGANSFIPPNGFVISGHGKAKNWINKYVTEGAYIKVDPSTNTIESIITPETYTFKAEQKIENVKKVISDYRALSVEPYEAKQSEELLAKAQLRLDDAKSYMDKGEYENVQFLSKQAAEIADQALYHAIPAKAGEFHGVWLRPVEKSRLEISDTLDRLKNAGINNIFVETYFHGYTIFPSKSLEKYGVLSQRKEFQGWDPLKVWIDEAHKRGMKVNVWFQTFYAGNEDISKNPQHVLSVYPSWANMQKRNNDLDKPSPSISEHNGYFLDPANPEVQKYLTDLISEIVNSYNIDGLNIDYIRYPASLSANFPGYIESSWGYTKFARNEFMTLYGVDPVCLTTADPLWQKWVDYRQGKVTSFVSTLKSIVGNKNILISTVIFPDKEESLVAKLQNWKEWADNSYIDAFTPLIMGSDQYLAESYVKQIKDNVVKPVLIYPGLFEPFNGGTPADLLYQIKAIRGVGASGLVIFDNAHLSADFNTALRARAFSENKK